MKTNVFNDAYAHAYIKMLCDTAIEKGCVKLVEWVEYSPILFFDSHTGQFKIEKIVGRYRPDKRVLHRVIENKESLFKDIELLDTSKYYYENFRDVGF